MPKEEIASYDYSEAHNIFADLLTKSDNSLNLTTFDDFVQNIFSKSHPEFDYDAWHIRYLSQVVDERLSDPNNNYLEAVLPRMHLKSHLLGYATTLYRMLKTKQDCMYVSYKEDLAMWHLSNIKAIIRDNPILSKVMKDMSPQSDSLINYEIDHRRVRVYGTGVMSMERGRHVGGLLVADDILGDLQNPLVLTELETVKKLFHAVIVNIPTRGCPIFVIGTPIDYSDLLYELKNDERFKSLWMPAIKPDLEHEVLWPKKYDMKWLMRQRGEKASTIRAFASEFLLTPVVALDTIINRDMLASPVIDKSLTNIEVPGF